MGIFRTIANFFRRAPTEPPPLVQKSSPGERQIVTLFPGWASAGLYATWSANRAELVQHYKGWNFIAIKAIAEEIASLDPQVAVIHRAEDISNSQRKSNRFLPARQRIKALTTLQEGEELEALPDTHKLVRLLRNPNPPDVCWTFFYKTSMWLDLVGNSYVWMVRNRMKEPTELWPIPPQWVRPRSGKDKIFEAFEVRPMAGYINQDWGGGWFPGGAGMLEIDAEDMIHISYPHPINPFDGYAPLTAISQWVDVGEAVDNSRVSHFLNGMFPGVAIEIDGSINDPNPDTIKRVQEDIKARYVGVRRTKVPIILGPGMKLVPWNSTPEEMDYTQSADQMKSWILAGHRVGESIAGLSENTVYASMVAARANFYQSTIRPKLKLLGQIFTEHLARQFDDRYVIYWDDATPKDPELELRRHQAYLTAGVLTINEVRAEIGKDPYEHGGDDPIMPMGQSPIPLATGEEPADLPVPALAAQKQGAEQPGMPGAPGQAPAQEPPEEPKGPLKDFASARAGALKNLLTPKAFSRNGNGRLHA